jgi:hypothetical protein
MTSAVELLRARHRTWPNDVESHNLFAGSVTIDPSEVEQAWTILSRSTWELEIAGLPSLLHHALLATLKRESLKSHDPTTE